MLFRLNEFPISITLDETDQLNPTAWYMNCTFCRLSHLNWLSLYSHSNILKISDAKEIFFGKSRHFERLKCSCIDLTAFQLWIFNPFERSFSVQNKPVWTGSLDFALPISHWKSSKMTWFLLILKKIPHKVDLGWTFMILHIFLVKTPSGQSSVNTSFNTINSTSRISF